MDDDVYNLLGTLAKANGTNRSAFIEQLILRAGDLSLAPQIQELLGVMATRADMTRTTVPGDAGTEGRCCRNLAASPAETEALVEALGQTEWEEQAVPLVSRIVEGATHPQLPQSGRQ